MMTMTWGEDEHPAERWKKRLLVKYGPSSKCLFYNRDDADDDNKDDDKDDDNKDDDDQDGDGDDEEKVEWEGAE